MKRVVNVSLFAIGISGGVLIGALMSDSSESLSSHARDSLELENRREIDVLASEVARLRGAMAERGGEPVGAAVEDHAEPNIAEIAAREREMSERRAAVIGAAVNREAVDPDWARAMQLRIASGVAAHGASGSRLISTICKTTICVAEIEHPPGDDGTGHLSWRAMFGLSRGFVVHHEPTSGGGHRSVAYLARDGYSLPR